MAHTRTDPSRPARVLENASPSWSIAWWVQHLLTITWFWAMGSCVLKSGAQNCSVSLFCWEAGCGTCLGVSENTGVPAMKRSVHLCAVLWNLLLWACWVRSHVVAVTLPSFPWTASQLETWTGCRTSTACAPHQTHAAAHADGEAGRGTRPIAPPQPSNNCN